MSPDSGAKINEEPKHPKKEKPGALQSPTWEQSPPKDNRPSVEAPKAEEVRQKSDEAKTKKPWNIEDHEKTSEKEKDEESRTPNESKTGAPMQPNGLPPSREPYPPTVKAPQADAPKAVKRDRGRSSAARDSDRPTTEKKKTKKRKKNKIARPRTETPSGDRSPTESADRLARPVAPRRSATSESHSERKSPTPPKRSRSPVHTGARRCESNSPKAAEPLHVPKLVNLTRKPRHGRERASSAKDKATEFVPLSCIDRDDSQFFKIGPPASSYRGHSATFGRPVKFPNRYPLSCAQCNSVHEANRIVTVCHKSEPSVIACLECTCNLLEGPVSNH
jgi:hypothetical protein